MEQTSEWFCPWRIWSKTDANSWAERSTHSRCVYCYWLTCTVITRINQEFSEQSVCFEADLTILRGECVFSCSFSKANHDWLWQLLGGQISSFHTLGVYMSPGTPWRLPACIWPFKVVFSRCTLDSNHSIILVWIGLSQHCRFWTLQFFLILLSKPFKLCQAAWRLWVNNYF